MEAEIMIQRKNERPSSKNDSAPKPTVPKLQEMLEKINIDIIHARHSSKLLK